MNIAFAASEVFPFAKTGGLADVAGALPKSVAAYGNEIKVFMPKYSLIDESKYGLRYNWEVGEIPVRVAGHVRPVYLLQSRLPDSNVEINFIDCPHYFNRSAVYTNDRDEDERFILFSKAVIEILQRMKWVPDIIHCNDWQTGLLPLFLKDNYKWDRMFDKTSVLFTIHNIEYQGRFSKDVLFKAEIREDLYYPGGPVELDQSVCFLKAGIVFSEIINTVSRTYANEILTPEYGAGMEKSLLSRKNDLYGIVNGVDYNIWNPDTDIHLPYKYSINDLSGKIKNKEYLLGRINFKFDKDIALIGIISRLVSQKGFDIVSDAFGKLARLPAQWIILGSGEDRYEDFFFSLCHSLPGKVYAYIGYNNELAHMVEAASDIFLMPSRYEPCGLNQIYSLKYGTVPVVRKTGGLADTVDDWDEMKLKGLESGTGFSFNDYSSNILNLTIERALQTFADKKTWTRIQLNGMAKDYSWTNSAREYIELYKMAVKRKT